MSTGGLMAAGSNPHGRAQMWASWMAPRTPWRKASEAAAIIRSRRAGHDLPVGLRQAFVAGGAVDYLPRVAPYGVSMLGDQRPQQPGCLPGQREDQPVGGVGLLEGLAAVAGADRPGTGDAAHGDHPAGQVMGHGQGVRAAAGEPG